MKKLLPIGIVLTVVAAAGAVFVGVGAYASHYLTNQSAAAVCQGQHTSHTVIIQNNSMQPQHTQAALCDTLTIVNRDDTVREIAFGIHNHHVSYDGIQEEPLKQGASLTITLNQLGTYLFHDHLHDEVTGGFTVTDK
jgi:plastocyanin